MAAAFSTTESMDVLRLANMNSELEEILRQMPPMQPFDFSSGPQVLRSATRRILENTGNYIQQDNVIEEERQILTRDASSITVRIYTPRNSQTGGGPLLIMYHAGGYCAGDIGDEGTNCRNFATIFGGIAISVGYRLAPEFPFPVPVNDAYDALKWASLNARNLNADPEKGFLVGGTSAGANFAAVVSHLYRDEKISPSLTGVYLSIPSVVHNTVVPEKYKPAYLSYEQNRDAMGLNQKSRDAIMNWYKPDPMSPLASPLLFPTGHENLPRTYLQICGMDPLRDDSIIYERVLQECGVETRVSMYPGLPHGFWTFFPNANFTNEFLKETLAGFAWLLQKRE